MRYCVRIEVCVANREGAEFYTAVQCHRALQKIGMEATLEVLTPLRLLELLQMPPPDRRLAIGSIPEPLQHVPTWQMSALPPAVDPIPLPRLPTKFPITLFDNLDEAQMLPPLLDALQNIPVHLFGHHRGSNWFSRLKFPDHRFLHPALPFSEHSVVLQQTHIFIANGSDAWILSALAAGALVLTSPTPLLKEYEQLFYTEETLKERIDDFLVHPEHAQHMIAELQHKLLPRHSWEACMQHVIRYNFSRK